MSYLRDWMRAPNFATSIIMSVLTWIGDSLAVRTLPPPWSFHPHITTFNPDLPLFNNLADELVGHRFARTALHLHDRYVDAVASASGVLL
jgi:hypothetical protein